MTYQTETRYPVRRLVRKEINPGAPERKLSTRGGTDRPETRRPTIARRTTADDFNVVPSGALLGALLHEKVRVRRLTTRASIQK